MKNIETSLSTFIVLFSGIFWENLICINNQYEDVWLLPKSYAKVSEAFRGL